MTISLMGNVSKQVAQSLYRKYKRNSLKSCLELQRSDLFAV
jgi:hypothetical protein